MIDEEQQPDVKGANSGASEAEVTSAAGGGNPISDAQDNSWGTDGATKSGSEFEASDSSLDSNEAESGEELLDDDYDYRDYQLTLAERDREIQSLKSQLEERTGQYMRIAADFDNFRRRTAKEKEDLEQQLKCSTINELLPVVDNFERARSQIKPQTDEGMNIHKSYQSVYKQLVDCLKRVGVAPMRSEGKEFDPNLHEAVMREATDQYPEGTVIEELVRGYMLGERVLRHAMVKVATPPEPDETGSEAETANS